MVLYKASHVLNSSSEAVFIVFHSAVLLIRSFDSLLDAFF